MSREIKFRYWDKEKKQMVYDPTLGSEGKVIIKVCGWNGLQFEQFTGLKDKNGKEIYEGDIVKNLYVSPLDNKEKSHIWVVEYETGMYWLRHINKMKHYDSSLFLKFTRIEVVGNVHENPELLVK